MSKSKQKGTAFESLIVGYLQQFFPHVERRALSGTQDKGDVAGLPLVLELKNCRAMQLSEWMHEAQKEAENAGTVGYCVVHKRKGVGDPALQYVTLPLFYLVDLLQS